MTSSRPTPRSTHGRLGAAGLAILSIALVAPKATASHCGRDVMGDFGLRRDLIRLIEAGSKAGAEISIRNQRTSTKG